MIEADITSTSHPFVEILLGPTSQRPYYRISTNQANTGYYDKSGKFIQDGTALITDAIIEGVVPHGRKGSFSIKDLTGVWPGRFADIGRAESSKVTGTGPNLVVSFGWQGLKTSRDYYEGASIGGHIKKMTGKVMSTKFDIADDGAVTIAVEYVAYTATVYQDIIAYDWNDIIKSEPEELWKKMLQNTGSTTTTTTTSRGRGGTQGLGSQARAAGGSASAKTGNNPTAIDVINYILKPDSGFSYSEVLKKKKIEIQLRSTGSFSAQQLSGYSELIMIEFGQPLSQWLQSMLGKVILTEDSQKKAQDRGVIVTYERKPDEEKYITNGNTTELTTIIVYDWNVIPDPESKNTSAEETRIKNNVDAWLAEKEAMLKYNKGPVLYWKAGQDEYAYIADKAKVVALNTVTYNGLSSGYSFVSKKRVLNWASDLNNHDQIFRMFKDGLSERLSELQERDDWNKLMKSLKNVNSMDEIKDIAEGKSGWLKNIGHFFNGVNVKSVTENFATMSDLASQMAAAAEGREIPNKDQNLASIFAQNVFNVTVEIMGDPDLGTSLPGGNTIITTDFSFAGATDYTRKVFDTNGKEIEIVKESIIDMFSRQWMLMNTSHNFSSDGKYITKLTLIGYMPKATEPKKSSMMHSGHVA